MGGFLHMLKSFAYLLLSNPCKTSWDQNRRVPTEGCLYLPSLMAAKYWFLYALDMQSFSGVFQSNITIAPFESQPSRVLVGKAAILPVLH